MNIPENLGNSDLTEIISQLEQELSVLEERQRELEIDLGRYKSNESAYYEIFRNTTAAIWEEDYSDVLLRMMDIPATTEKEYSSYLDNNPEVLKDLIARIRIVEINDAVPRLFGAENKSRVLEEVGSLFIPESFSTFRDQFAVLASGGTFYECETTGLRLDGTKFNILLSVFFPDITGRKVIVNMLDITSRKNREQEQENILKEAVEQKKIADILVDITLTLATKVNMNDILDTLLEQIEKVIKATSSSVMLVQNSRLVIARHRGYEKFGAAEFITEFADQISERGLSRRFWEDGEVKIISNTREYDGWVIFPETSYVRSYMAIPIEWQGETLGLLNLDSDQENSFSPEDAEKIRPIVHALVISLHNAQLFDKAKSEINERLAIEKTLNSSLQEKELLLQEIHHRVKNNLTIIIALISLENIKINSSFEYELFEELNQRVHSIALVHEKLYENKDLSSIDLKTYTKDLVNSIQSVIAYKGNIKIRTDIPAGVYLNLDTLVPLGLILNELITNSLKYAFTRNTGKVVVEFEKLDNSFRLTISDNGQGFPEDILENTNVQLGLTLVNSLVQQIGGEIQYANREGASVEISLSLSSADLVEEEISHV